MSSYDIDLTDIGFYIIPFGPARITEGQDYIDFTSDPDEFIEFKNGFAVRIEGLLNSDMIHPYDDNRCAKYEFFVIEPEGAEEIGNGYSNTIPGALALARRIIVDYILKQT